MQNFQDTFKTRKRSFISAFSIFMTVPLKYKYFVYNENFTFYNFVHTMKIKTLSHHFKIK